MLKIKLRNYSNRIVESIDILVEGRKEDAANLVKKLYSSDPEKKLAAENALQIFLQNPIADHKYLSWMLKHFEEAEDTDAMMLAVSYYDIFQKNIESDNPLKNINNIKSFEDLKGVIEDYSESMRQLETKGQKIIVSKEQTGGRFEIIRPMNVYAACEVGKNSRWCTAATKSRNYFKSYSKHNIALYTIIDYSKPQKDENSMFTYGLSMDKERFKHLEIYNSADTKIEREDVANSIGADNERSFFEEMLKERDLKIPSATLEKYNTFYTRISKLIKAFPRIEDPFEKEVPKESIFTDIVGEVTEFYNDWGKIYFNEKSSDNEKREAQRHVKLFTKKLLEVDNPYLTYNLGVALQDKKIVIDLVPDLLAELVRNPSWINTAEGDYKEFLYNVRDLENSDDVESEERETEINKRLSYFTQQAVLNKRTDLAERLYSVFSDAEKELISADPRAKNVYKRLLLTISKTSVQNMDPGAFYYLKKMLDKHTNLSEWFDYIMFTRDHYGIAINPTLTKLYGNDVARYTLEKIEKQNDDWREENAEKIYNSIIRVKNLDSDIYKEALDKSESWNILTKFCSINDINSLPEDYQKKCAQNVFEFYDYVHEDSHGSSTTLAGALYGITLSKTLPIQIIEKAIEKLCDKHIREIPEDKRENLYKTWINKGIQSPSFDKFVQDHQQNLVESRIFKFDKDLKIFRII